MINNYNLQRFEEVHKKYYQTALSEMKNGRKQSHWMWYIFPQLKGLGKSGTSDYYGISNIDEAKAYLSHPILRKNLIEISEALLKLPINNVTEIFGKPDDMKLKSCMTLFSMASEDDKVFDKVLSKFFIGKYDIKTLNILERESI